MIILCFCCDERCKRKKVKILIRQFSSILNFEGFLERRVETLSMGEKKKAMLLCGLCTDMKVLIMDEPSNGLDIDSQVEMKNLIQYLATRYQKTFIVSSHDWSF